MQHFNFIVSSSMSLRGGRGPTTLAPHCVRCSAGEQSPHFKKETASPTNGSQRHQQSDWYNKRLLIHYIMIFILINETDVL
jgi:hypothetical protein